VEQREKKIKPQKKKKHRNISFRNRF